MTWFFFALSATGFLILYNLLSRILAVKSHNPRAFTTLYNAIAALFCFVFFFYEPYRSPTLSWQILLLTIIGLLIWALFARAEFATKKLMEASALTVIMRFAPLVTFLVSFVLLGENFTWSKILALLLIISANLVLLTKNVNLKFNRGLLLALILAVTLGLGWFFDKLVSGFYALSFYSILSFGIPSIFNALTPPINLKEIGKEWQISSWKIPLLAFFNVTGYYLYLLALKTGEVSKVALIISMAGIITMILGVWLLKERDYIRQKLAAGVLILISLFLLR